MAHWLRRFLLAAAVLVACFSTASADMRKLNAPARLVLESLRSGVSLETLAAEGAAVSPQGELDVFILGDVSRAQLEGAGARVRTELPGLFTAFIPADAIEAVAGLSAVQSIHGAVVAEVEHDLSIPATNASIFRAAGPAFTGLNGAGVLVGCVDTGVDWTHDDFKNPGGTTRLVGIWDQTVAGVPPAPFGYGNECTPAQINAATCTQTATDGHGTHTLGSAGGDGSQVSAGSAPAFTYAGMAPVSDLIMVKTSFTTSALVDGIAYCMNKATSLGMNAAINFSIGSHYGPKDGTSPFESGMSALTGPGRIVCKSAGNEGGQLRHAELFAVNPFAEAQMSITGSALNRVIQIAGYYNATETVNFTLVSPNGTIIGPIALGGSSNPTTANGAVYVENGIVVYPSGAREIFIDIRITNSVTQNFNGTWKFQVTPVVLGAANGEVDFWRFVNSTGTTANFTTAVVSNRELVSEPGNAFNLITVAAWVSKRYWTDCNANALVNFNGAINPGPVATFSSPGPTRDGRQKPDIAAPGTAIASARSSWVGTTCPAGVTSVLPGGRHVMNQGTSMAAPHATGASALFMQKYGALTPAQMVALMASRAVTDGFTGAVWNKDYGNGKLWMGDMTDPNCTVLSPDGGEVVVVGSMINLTWNASDPYLGVTGVDIHLSRDNGFTTEIIALNLANSGSYAWMVTGPTTNLALLRVTARDAAGNAGIDLSNAVWAIIDPPVSTVVSLFQAESVEGGVQLAWEFTDPSLFDRIAVERAGLASGPWSELEAEITTDGASTIALDRTATAGQTYYYRLAVTYRNGGSEAFGPIKVTVGQPITEFAVAQISPNPTAGRAMIEYTVPRQSEVSVAMFDLQGREVATLASGPHEVGRYQVSWSGELDGGRAQAGVYFIRILSQGVSQTRRIVVSR